MTFPELFTWVTGVLLVYYAVHTLLFGLVVARAAVSITRELAWPDDVAHELTFANPLTPGVTVILPAHDEEAGIVEAVRAVLELRYPLIEVVVVDDGSTDRTAELLHREFDLRAAGVPVTAPRVPQHGPTRATFRSRRHPRLVLVQKDSVGRRSDAVNAGIRVSTQPILCMIDADSILEPDALLRSVQPFVDDPDVVATGGVVLPSNGSAVDRGRITAVGVPRRLVERTQVLEYLRAFLVGRSGWAALGGMLIISGAFGVYRREVVLEVGGLDPHSLAEDAELVVAVHRARRRAGLPHRMVFVAEPVCWTEVPTTLAVLRRQRHRWSQGLGELLGQHRDMIGRPRHGVLGAVTMPYFLAFELLGPVAEIVAVPVVAVGAVLGLVSPLWVLVMLAVSVLLSVVVSLASLLVEELSFARFPRARDLVALVVAAALEPFWFRPLHTWWRAVGLVRALRGRESEWGEMTRTGFLPAAEPARAR